MSHKEFKAYSTKDYVVASNLHYPRVSVVFHETPQRYKSGKLKHSWTHSKSVIYNLYNKSPYYKVKQYAAECMKTFRCIPDYTIISASQFSKTHNISHVTAKKILTSESKKVNSNVMQISPRYFAIYRDKIAEEFINKILMIFYREARTTKSGLTIRGLTLPAILRRLQKLKDYSLTHKYAYYNNVAKILTQPVLSFFISIKVIGKIQLDFVYSRKTVVYLRW